MLSIEIQIVQTHVSAVLPLLEEIDRLVDRNSIHPGKEAGISLERFQGLERLDEGLLREVVGVLVIGSHVINRRVNALLIAVDQFVKGAKITRLSAPYQHAFFRG